MSLRKDPAADQSEYNQVTIPSLPDIVSNTQLVTTNLPFIEEKIGILKWYRV